MEWAQSTGTKEGFRIGKLDAHGNRFAEVLRLGSLAQDDRRRERARSRDGCLVISGGVREDRDSSAARFTLTSE